MCQSENTPAKSSQATVGVQSTRVSWCHRRRGQRRRKIQRNVPRRAGSGTLRQSGSQGALNNSSGAAGAAGARVMRRTGKGGGSVGGGGKRQRRLRAFAGHAGEGQLAAQ